MSGRTSIHDLWRFLEDHHFNEEGTIYESPVGFQLSVARYIRLCAFGPTTFYPANTGTIKDVTLDESPASKGPHLTHQELDGFSSDRFLFYDTLIRDFVDGNDLGTFLFFFFHRDTRG